MRRVRSASTFRTNSRVVASWPCFRTEYGPWYQAASASVRFPLNSRSRWRRYATPIRMLPGRRPRHLVADQHRLDVRAGGRQHLQHAAGAGRRDEPGLEARLHPRERPDERGVEAVGDRPVGQHRAHARRRGGGRGADRPHAGSAAPERPQRDRPGDAVDREPLRALVAAQRALGGLVEEAVDGHELAAAREHELQHRDVPAEDAATQRPPAEDAACRAGRARAASPVPRGRPRRARRGAGRPSSRAPSSARRSHRPGRCRARRRAGRPGDPRSAGSRRARPLPA